MEQFDRNELTGFPTFRTNGKGKPITIEDVRKALEDMEDEEDMEKAMGWFQNPERSRQPADS